MFFVTQFLIKSEYLVLSVELFNRAGMLVSVTRHSIKFFSRPQAELSHFYFIFFSILGITSYWCYISVALFLLHTLLKTLEKRIRFLSGVAYFCFGVILMYLFGDI